jgi:predicted nucleic acid-binding protein
VVLVDTSVWVDYFNGVDCWQADHLDRLLGTDLVLIGDLILAELLQGFAKDSDRNRARALLSDLTYADLVGRDVALAAAENYRKLRRRGLTVRKTIDVLIGTFCIVNDHELLHADLDFDPVEKHLGLRVVHRP